MFLNPLPHRGFIVVGFGFGYSFGAIFWTFLSLEITVHDNPMVRLPVLKVCIWEGLTPFYRPQLGIPFNFVLREISGLEVR